MTKKDYVLIAAAIRAAQAKIEDCEPPQAHNDLLDGVAYTRDYLCDMLAQDNPRFDRARFLAACGVQS